MKTKIEMIEPWYIKNNLERRLLELEELRGKIIQAQMENDKKCFGKSLRVVRNHKTYAYYIRRSGHDSKGIYLSKENRDLAKTLAFQEYYRKLLTEVNKEIEVLKTMNENWEDNGIQDVFRKMPQGKKILLEPVIYSDDEYILKWKNKEYMKKSSFDENEDFITADGEKVRSKSEVILADTLRRFGVPYRYEFPLKMNLKDGKKIEFHPDFCCLNVRTRKEYYWEHFGMMNNSEYSENAIKKIINYRKNGFFEGENMIYTYESSEIPLNCKMIEMMIKKYLL